MTECPPRSLLWTVPCDIRYPARPDTNQDREQYRDHDPSLAPLRYEGEGTNCNQKDRRDRDAYDEHNDAA